MRAQLARPEPCAEHPTPRRSSNRMVALTPKRHRGRSNVACRLRGPFWSWSYSAACVSARETNPNQPALCSPSFLRLSTLAISVAIAC